MKGGGEGGGGDLEADRESDQKRGHGVVRTQQDMLTNYLRAVGTVPAMPLPSIQHFLSAELGWQIL